MNIQPINNTVTKNLVNNQISFKEADFIEDYVKTPYCSYCGAKMN